MNVADEAEDLDCGLVRRIEARGRESGLVRPKLGGGSFFSRERESSNFLCFYYNYEFLFLSAILDVVYQINNNITLFFLVGVVVVVDVFQDSCC